MKITALTPMINTKSITATIDYYTNILGFVCTSGGEELGWATLSRNNVNIMLAAQNDHRPFDKPIFTGSFYIYTDDVNGVWQSLRDKVNLCYPIETFEYGMREFGFFDNNGYLLQFGQSVKQLVEK